MNGVRRKPNCRAHRLVPALILALFLLGGGQGIALALDPSVTPTPAPTLQPSDGTPVAQATASSTPAEPVENAAPPGLFDGLSLAVPSDWPQVQGNPQHTGYAPEVLGTNFQVAWRYPFQPEKVHPQVQAIVYGGKIFVGTEMGNLIAIDARTGSRAWVYRVGSPILNSVAAGSGRVYFGAMDGAAYALDAATGQLIWKTQLSPWIGFSTAPVVADGKVMLGGRDSVFYALEPATGSVLWKRDVGAPILQTAAWDNGRAFFGAMDMRVYAINSADGSLAWRTEPLSGMAFKDYWAVVTHGVVLIHATGLGSIPIGFPFVEMWDKSDPELNWVMQNGPTIAQGGLTSLSDAMAAQDRVMADVQANPTKYTRELYVLDAATGREAYAVPHWIGQTMNGTTTPACVDRDGRLVVPVPFVRSGWGRLDLTTHRIVDLLYDHTDADGGPMEPGDTPAGSGNPDENLNVTCTGNLILAMHTEEYNANYTGAFDLDNRRWIHIGAGHENRQMSTNTQGGGGNPASVVDCYVYHITFYELVARTTH